MYTLIETIKSMAGIPKAKGKHVSSPLHSVLRNCGVKIVLIKLPKTKWGKYLEFLSRKNEKPY